MRPQLTPQLAAQKVAFTTSTQSAAFAAGTKVIRVCASAACWVVIGSNPTATVATGIYLPANVPAWFGVTAGQKIAAIQDTGGGNLSVVEGSSL